MKKLLSALLAVSMILSLAIPMSFATTTVDSVPTTTGTELKVSFADHMEYITATALEGDDKFETRTGQFSDFVLYYTSRKDVDFTFSVPFKVTEAGYYDLSYVGTVSQRNYLPQNIQSYVSGDVSYEFYLDNFSSPIYSQNSKSASNVNPWTKMPDNGSTRYFQSSTSGKTGVNWYAYKFTKTVYLTAGEHSFNGLAAPLSGGLKFCADYVSVKKAESVNPVPDGTELKVGFADNMSYITATALEGSDAFETRTGQFSDFVLYYTSRKDVDFTFSVPFTVTEAGFYDLSYVGTASNKNYLPQDIRDYVCGDVAYEFYVDNFSSPIYSQNGSSEITAPWTKMPDNGSTRYFQSSTSGKTGVNWYAYKFTKTVYLTAGEHSFKGLAAPISGGLKFGADYVSVKKIESTASDAENVTADGNAKKFSFTENYNKYLFNFKSDGANVNTSDDGAKFAIYTATSGQTVAPSYRFPVNILVDGVYKIDIKTHVKFQNAKGAYILVNNKAVASIADMEENTGTSNKLYIANASEQHEERVYSFYVYLKQGYNTIGGTYVPTDSGALNFAAEYLEISKANDDIMTQSITANGGKIELEDGTYIRNVGNKYFQYDAGLKYFGKNGSYYPEDKLYVSNIRLNVAESGTYDLEYLLSEKTASNSKIELLLNGEVIGDNTVSGTAASGYVYTYKETTTGNLLTNDALAAAAPMKKYTTSMDLTAGTYTLQVVVHKNSANTFTYAFDNIEFRAYKDYVTVSNGYVSARGMYNDTVSGTAILALYNGKELVHVAKVAANGTKIDFSSTFSGTVTSAKLFVWEDLDNVKPKVEAKVFNLNQ